MKKLANKAVLFFYIVLALFRRQRSGAPKKFLVIDTLRLGDVIMSTPILKAIKEKYPESRVSVLVRPTIGDILKGNPFIDEIMPYEKEMDITRLIRGLRKKKFYICINLCEGKLNSTIYAAGIPVRIGYIQKHKYRDRFLLTHPLRWTGDFKGMPALFAKLLEPLGIVETNTELTLYPDAEDINFVRRLIPCSHKNLKIIIHPGGRNLTRRWPYYRELIPDINKKFDACIILTGDNNELQLVNNIIDGLDGINIVNLVGKTTLKQLVALCSIADIVIGNDTGILHLARAVKTPTITIFGPEDPKITGNTNTKDIQVFIDVPCKTDMTYFGITIPDVRRCKKEVCESHICMKDITPEMVFKEIQKVVES